MHEAILKNGFRNYRTSLRLRHQGHKLCLHVRGKTGIGLGTQVRGFQSTWRTAHLQSALVDLLNLDANFAELGYDPIAVFRITVFDLQLAVRDGGGHEKTSAPSLVKLARCRSIGLAPIAQPPGSETRALPNRASKGPSANTDARIVFTSS